MRTLIVTLLIIAAVGFFFEWLFRRDRSRTIKALILIYLENASPLSANDIMGCLNESGIQIRSITLYNFLNDLVNAGKVAGSIHRINTDPYDRPSLNGGIETHFYSLIK